MSRALILDRDSWSRSESARLCRSLGYAVRSAAARADAEREVANQPYDLVVADADSGGFELLDALQSLVDAPAVVLTSRDFDVSTALNALRRGAHDLLASPLDASELRNCLSRVAPPATTDERTDGTIVGGSEPLTRVRDLVSRVAGTERSTVLVLGESGTGKELVARAIHDESARRNGPFVAVNCAALTDSLLEAELFGYEAGAFTGAARGGRDGLLAAADGGTLLLDEVGELAPALQAKLLRVLQERTFRRVGGSADVAFNARIVASTHRNLVAMVREGAFREDLFYRLNVLSIHVPPLRERRSDIPLLAQSFLEELARERGATIELAPEALDALCAHEWPGNVRELRNTLERAALIANDERVDVEHLELELPGALEQGSLRPHPAPHPTHRSGGLALDQLPLEDCSLRRVEEEVIRHVMGASEGNRSRAARVLGVNRSTLYSKLKAYRIG